LQTPVWSEQWLNERRVPKSSLSNFTLLSLNCCAFAMPIGMNGNIDEWLLDQARRPADYEYSDKQWALLKRLVARTKTFTQYAGYTVPDLVAIAYPARLDLDER